LNFNLESKKKRKIKKKSNFEIYFFLFIKIIATIKNNTIGPKINKA